jgi:hypothetical protein
MSHFTRTSAVHAVVLAGGLALFAAAPALAARPSDPHAGAQVQMASRAGDASDRGVSAQYASRAGEQSDRGVSAQYASRAGDREDGANADA